MLRHSEYFLLLHSQVTGYACRRARAVAPSGNGLGIHYLEEVQAFVKFGRQQNERRGAKSETVAAKTGC